MSGTAVDWAAIRRAYQGGRGGTLADMADRFGVPIGTLFCRCANEHWREDNPRPASRSTVRRRAAQLLREWPTDTAAEVRRRLQCEFGADHPALPSERSLRHARQPNRPRAPLAEPRPGLDGLTRMCPDCGQRTIHDPCQWCAAVGPRPVWWRKVA